MTSLITFEVTLNKCTYGQQDKKLGNENIIH